MTTIITLQNATTRLKIKADNLKNTQDVLARLMMDDSCMYIDDHNKCDRTQELSSGWVLVEYKDRLCPFPVNQMGACLNPLYLSKIDNQVHLGTLSIGPYYPDLEALDAAGLVYYTI